MNFRDTIGHAIDAAATGAVGTAKSLVSYAKQIVTQVGDAGTGDTNANTSLHELKHKDANHTFSAATDSVEAIRDELDNGTYGLSAIETLVDGLETAVDNLNTGLVISGPCSLQFPNVDQQASPIEVDIWDANDDFASNAEITAPGTIDIYRFRTGTDIAWQTIVNAAALTETGLGSVSYSYAWPAASWAQGDMFRIHIGGVQVTLGTKVFELPRKTFHGVVGMGTGAQNITSILTDTGTDGVVVNTFTAGGKGEIQTEANDALVANALDHLQAVTTVAADMTAEVVDGSVISRVLSKTSDTSTYDSTTDSLEMLSDKVGAYTGDGGVGADDSVKAELDVVRTEIAALPTDADVNAQVDIALDTIVPASPTAGSVNDMLSKAAGGNTFSKATDSLEMLSDKLGGFSGDGGAAQDDSVKASLDLAHTDLDAILVDTAGITTFKDQWCATPIASLAFGSVAADKDFANVVFPAGFLPANSTVDSVFLMVHWRKQVDTSTALNAINAASKTIRIKKTSGAWGTDDIVAITMANGGLSTAASATEGGTIVIGNVDVKSEVDDVDNETYNIESNQTNRTDAITVTGASLTLYDIYTGLRVYYHM